jgi:hypothetical protein
MTIIDFSHGTTKEFDGATIETCNLEGKKVMKMHIHPGFDWNKAVGCKMAGSPTSCQHAHFGYMESGSMKIKYDDGTEETIKHGETYFIKPGHLPEVNEETIMIEFAEDTHKMFEDVASPDDDASSASSSDSEGGRKKEKKHRKHGKKEKKHEKKME